MKKVLITRKLKLETLEQLERDYELDVWHSADEPMPRDELLSRSAGVDAILCMLSDTIDRELIDAAGNQLKVVSTMSVGYDHIDTKLLSERGIRIGYTPEVLTDSVADTTIALMLMASRRLPEAIDAAKNGDWSQWSPYWMTGHDLSRSTVGIIGLGAIGVEVAKRLSGFGCTVLYSSRTRKQELEQQLGIRYVDEDELLSSSDFVTVHCALSADTENMCDEQFFAKMKPSSVFINTSRGGLVDQDALYSALNSRRIYAAGLDVTIPEPLPTDHPLFQLDNCIILPHISSASILTRDDMADTAIDNLISGLEGKEMKYEVKP